MREENTSTWRRAHSPIASPWADQIDPKCPLPEYPRPQMRREAWMNLNGMWDYAITPKEIKEPPAFAAQILVPFPIESAASGVKRPLLPTERLWYRRTFSLPKDWAEKRVLLHFGAVDWETAVTVNGKEVGLHMGGYTPFTMEITDMLIEENELLVSVWDPGDASRQERGKQTLKPGMAFYSAASGIWQTVWLEAVPQTFLSNIILTPDIDDNVLKISVEVDGESEGKTLSVKASANGIPCAKASGEANQVLKLAIPYPHLWSPDDPFLYDLSLTLKNGEETLDTVESYFGMRKFSLGKDKKGTPRLMLNNQPLFMLGPLDQGYWPEGIYTAPSDEALCSDIELCKRLGFNMVRKHVKVEPARWYYHADRLGIIVWQDMPNGGVVPWFFLFTAGVWNGWLKDTNYRRHGRQSKANREQFRGELKDMVDALYNTVSIGQWVPFNEGWGQFDAREIGRWLQEYDPGRVVDPTSGFFDQGGGDVVSYHHYVTRIKPLKKDKQRAVVLSEYGGYGLQIKGHLWQEEKLFGYKWSKTIQELTQAYLRLTKEELMPLIKAGLSGAIYTQLTDVEMEINGFVTYDRMVEKMDFEKIAAVHKKIIARSQPKT